MTSAWTKTGKIPVHCNVTGEMKDPRVQLKTRTGKIPVHCNVTGEMKDPRVQLKTHLCFLDGLKDSPLLPGWTYKSPFLSLSTNSFFSIHLCWYLLLGFPQSQRKCLTSSLSNSSSLQPAHPPPTPNPVSLRDAPNQAQRQDALTHARLRDAPSQALHLDGPTQALHQDGPTHANLRDAPSQAQHQDAPIHAHLQHIKDQLVVRAKDHGEIHPNAHPTKAADIISTTTIMAPNNTSRASFLGRVGHQEMKAYP
ncbi:PREDICTED: uncharacterized protein LOC107111152 [Gekko japonicus]|uniref:Uncharacterized protein LOC107111152 n=1 Tax=Gekko japonicus TaxID=146911 RepID=A0ABM1K1H9_GEKJA|nr:PREDICTED: uncharacterized protein LOC107111152 [Gekko japonicus]